MILLIHPHTTNKKILITKVSDISIIHVIFNAHLHYLCHYRSFREALSDLEYYKKRHMTSTGTQTSYNKPCQTSREIMWLAPGSQLPSVCVYFGWTLCFLTSIIAAFFTVLYSLEWGGDKANRWLTAFLLAASESIYIVNTIQVTVIIIMFCIIIGVINLVSHHFIK